MKQRDKKKSRKNVKKNTWLRNFKAFDLRLDRRQQQRLINPVDDETVRVCSNCGKEFNGRFCPQCGQDASWSRFSWKQEGRNMLSFFGVCKDVMSRTLKQAINHKPKKVKPVKKNTWKRKLKALDLRLDRRQRVGHTPPDADDTERTCTNCGEKYTGRYCPQCGQAGAWDRFSWRRIILNFLDIWGLGNRPMFRTVFELFWRPGYMVRDYLYGHRQLYFPPFKLLAVTIALTLFVNFLLGQKFESQIGPIVQSIDVDKWHLSPPISSILDGIISFGQFLSDHPLYEVLFLVLFMVCCVRVAFRRVGDYNFVETFIFMVFVVSQVYICELLAAPIKSLYHLAENQFFTNKMLSSSPFLAGAGGLLSMAASFISAVFRFFVLFLEVLDFHQFFGLSWKATIWRLFYVVFLAFVVLLVLVAIGATTFEKGLEWGICLTVLVIMIIVTYTFASNYLHKNKALVSRPIHYLSTRLSNILLLAAPFISAFGSKNLLGNHNVWIILAMTIICCVLAGVIAFLPSHLYKKHHRP